MPRQRKLTDDALRQFLNLGYTRRQISEMAHISEAAISKRIAALENRAARANPAAVQTAHAQLWDVRAAVEENYARCLQLLNETENAPDKVKALAEVRQHLQFALSILKSMYEIQEVQAFMDEVMAVIDECEPGTRERILDRLTARRSIRAAFYPPK